MKNIKKNISIMESKLESNNQKKLNKIKRKINEQHGEISCLNQIILTSLLSGLIPILGYLLPEIFQNYLDIPITIILFFGLGIPHGSVDNYIYQKVIEKKFQNFIKLKRENCKNGNGNENENIHGNIHDVFLKNHLNINLFEYLIEFLLPLNNLINIKTLTKEDVTIIFDIYFYTYYFFIMGIITFFWIYSPLSCLICFWILSCYHFGHADLHYLGLKNSLDFSWTTLGKIITFLSRGHMVLSCVMRMNPNFSWFVVSNLIRNFQIDQELFQDFINYSIYQHYYILLLWFNFLIMKKFSLLPLENNLKGINRLIYLMIEIFRSFIITELIFSPNLSNIILPSCAFSIYFGLWHSFTSICHIISFLKQDDLSSLYNDKNSNLNNYNYIFSNEKLLFNNKSILNVNEKNYNWITIKDLINFLKLGFRYTLFTYIFVVIGWILWLNYTGIVDKSGIMHIDIWSVMVLCISVVTGPHAWTLNALMYNFDP